MTPLVQSLWITLIGMGLVFIAILLLWGLMEGLMSLTARFFKEESADGEEQEGAEEGEPEVQLAPTPASDHKKRAAAAAVAVALALRKPAAPAAAAHASGSAWQAVTRTSQLNQPTHITRKPRGNVR